MVVLKEENEWRKSEESMGEDEDRSKELGVGEAEGIRKGK